MTLIAIAIAVAVIIAGRWRAASTPRRRALLPSVAGAACMLVFVWLLITDLVKGPRSQLLIMVAYCFMLVVPAAFLAGLLRSRLARGGLAQLFRELSGMRGDALQAALGRTLGDPSLVLAYRLPGSRGYADASGGRVLVPPVTPDRASVPIEDDDGEVAAIVYDASLDDDPEMVEAVRAAATIALENERLLAESEAQLAEVHASRQRIVAAGDAERRRLERDLHDGAQQRLVALSLQLRMLRSDIRRDPAQAEQLVDAASDELGHSLEELRELARGIHPATLDHGLSSALESLAARSTVATAVTCDAPEHVPRDVELALYFVACESLANVGKYAGATHGVGAAVADADGRRDRDRRRRRRRGRRDERLRAARPGRPRRGARRAPARDEPARCRHGGRRGAAVRIVIADDSALMREGIVAFLRRAAFDVVAQAASGEELLREVEEHEPDVAIIDIRMPPTFTDEGLRAAHEIRERFPEIGIVILSQHVETGTAARLLAESPGRLGYLLKDRVGDIDDFAASLRSVAAGGSALDPEIVNRLLASASRRRAARIAQRPRARGARAGRRGPLQQGDRRPARAQPARRPEARHRRLREARPDRGRRRQPPHPRRPRVPAAGRPADGGRGLNRPAAGAHCGTCTCLQTPYRLGRLAGTFMRSPESRSSSMQSAVILNSPPPAIAAATVVTARDVVRRYGDGDTAVDALRGVSVDIAAGNLTAVMGPSGSGKSTLMHILAGLDQPTAGEVSVAGVDIGGLDDTALTKLRRDHIGFIFQFFNLLPMLTAAENIALPLKLAGKTPDPEWLDELVAQVGLAERLSHRPSELSGGQQQRVAVARALVSRPSVMFADEPTGNLDSTTSGEILGLLRDSVDRLGQTTVMVTHDAHAAAIADRVLFLADGDIVRDLGPSSAHEILATLEEVSGR